MMAGDEKADAKSSVNISIGKETDAAFGDLIRGLLKRPAEETGNLLADWIGLLGDRVKQKRLINAQKGLEETRKILESREVPLDKISDVTEEDIHIVIDGMSVTGDGHIRKLWSGLLASALSPESVGTIERPITSAISALSPSDARIVEFVAFFIRGKREIDGAVVRAAGLEGKQRRTLADADRIRVARQSIGGRLSEFVERAKQVAAELELSTITRNSGWEDNLARLGIIRPKLNSFPIFPPTLTGTDLDVSFFDDLVKYIDRKTEHSDTLATLSFDADYLFTFDERQNEIILGVELTRFGEKFAKACGVL